MSPTLVRVVEAAIDQIARPELRREVFNLALSRGNAAEVPRTARHLLAFVSGPLYDVLSEWFGQDSADVVLDDVAPVLNRAAEHEMSGLRRRASGSAKEAPRPPSGTSVRSAVPPLATSSSSTRERSQGPLVLVVDADSPFRSAVDRVLAARGYRVMIATSGRQALSMCLKSRPDLVLSDLDAPAVDGRELAAILRRTFRDQSPPVVLLTASNVSLSPTAEVVKVVNKPIDPQRLLEILEPLIASRWPGDDSDG